MKVEEYLGNIKEAIDNVFGVDCQGICHENCPYDNICDKIESLSIAIDKLLENNEEV